MAFLAYVCFPTWFNFSSNSNIFIPCNWKTLFKQLGWVSGGVIPQEAYSLIQLLDKITTGKQHSEQKETRGAEDKGNLVTGVLSQPLWAWMQGTCLCWDVPGAVLSLLPCLECNYLLDILFFSLNILTCVLGLECKKHTCECLGIQILVFFFFFFAF